MGTKHLFSCITVLTIFFFTSCTTTNKVAYFQNPKDTTYKQNIKLVEAPLESNHFLKISISSSKSSVGASIFNPYPPEANDKTANAKGATDNFVSYLIDSDGNIEMPTLGKVKAKGRTKTELKDYITNQIIAQKLLLDPVVEIRLLNFEVTILGEVTSPSVITVPSEKITLVKALGMAGDITIYGKKDNVLLIREENGVRKTKRLDLTSSSFLASDYYYLHPNDVVYVEPNKARVAISGRSQQVLPLVLTSVSILVFVLDKVIK
jgi:polysaccharide biosynthesis/export protein